jgi:hypothetical protein
MKTPKLRCGLAILATALLVGCFSKAPVLDDAAAIKIARQAIAGVDSKSNLSYLAQLKGDSWEVYAGPKDVGLMTGGDFTIFVAKNDGHVIGILAGQ